jgi:MFS transporter, ACS family, glucarate transporter
MKYRNRTLGLLSVLTVITYLDRVCISVAGPRIQDSLHLSPAQWGWVTGIFTLSYAAFEIPTGLLGDRIGARRVLTRIVLWWSAFTTFTGMVGGYYSMLVTRFLFGAGEAGAYPNASVVIGRWFPIEERGRAFGIILSASQLGGAIAPLLVVPIQIRYGWRASFYLFGVIGVIWAALWYFWYRDSPTEKSGVTAAEIAETQHLVTDARHTLPWAIALRSLNFWRVPTICFCYIYTNVFFASWFHTYLVKARGFSEKQLLLSSLPFFVSACANLCGGLASHLLVRRIGLKWGRCALGIAGLIVAALSITGVLFTHNTYAALALLCLANGGITFQQPIAFAICLDIGGAYSGAIVGVFNTAAGAAGFVSSLAFGYIVSHTENYNLPFVPMAALLLIGAYTWFKFDPTEQLSPVAITFPTILPEATSEAQP